MTPRTVGAGGRLGLVIVETKVVGGGTESVDVVAPHGPTTLRDLLAALVRHELAAYDERREATRTLRVLTPADLARGAGTGSYGREPRAMAAPPTESAATARAWEAFEDGLYFVLLDGAQLEHLDDVADLRETSVLRLVRLVALAGG